MGHCQDKPPYSIASIYNYGKVRNTLESLTCSLCFCEVVIRYTHVLLFGALTSSSAFDRDTHYFPRMRISCNDVDSGMIHKGGFKTILREPI